MTNPTATAAPFEVKPYVGYSTLFAVYQGRTCVEGPFGNKEAAERAASGRQCRADAEKVSTPTAQVSEAMLRMFEAMTSHLFELENDKRPGLTDSSDQHQAIEDAAMMLRRDFRADPAVVEALVNAAYDRVYNDSGDGYVSEYGMNG